MTGVCPRGGPIDLPLKEHLMNRHCLMAAALLASLGLAAEANAQGMGQGMGGPGMMGMGAGRMMVDPATLPALKAQLALTPAQEAAWTSYAEGVSAAAETRQRMQDSARDLPMAERMATRGDRQAVGAQVHEEINQRRAALYYLLSADQRTILDREAPPLPLPPGR